MAQATIARLSAPSPFRSPLKLQRRSFECNAARSQLQLMFTEKRAIWSLQRARDVLFVGAAVQSPRQLTAVDEHFDLQADLISDPLTCRSTRSPLCGARQYPSPTSKRPPGARCFATSAMEPGPGFEQRPFIELEQLVQGCTFEDACVVLQEPPYSLKVRESVALPELYTVSYDMLRIIRNESTWLEPPVRQARGIILEKNTNRVVCRPFDKFFNSKEADHKRDPVDWTTARVYEKVDGSLMKCYHYKGEWRVATNRTVDASDAPVAYDSDRTFKDVFLEIWPAFPAGLDPDYTYMFEMCHPETRVIVPHRQGVLVYLGARHMPSHQEVFPEDLPVPGLDPPARYELASEADCLALAAKMPFSQEGFVAVDARFRRAKIKGPAYVWLAHVRANPSKDIRSVLFRILLQGETSGAALLPGIGPLMEPMKDVLEELLEKVLAAWNSVKDIEVQKDFALTIKKDHAHLMSMFFQIRKEAQRLPAFGDADVKRMAMELWLASRDEDAALKAARVFEVTLPEITDNIADGFYDRQAAFQMEVDLPPPADAQLEWRKCLTDDQ